MLVKGVFICCAADPVQSVIEWTGDAHMAYKLSTIGSDNGLSPGRRQANVWTSGGIMLTGLLEENLIEIRAFSFKKMHLKMSSEKWRPFCLGLNVLNVFLTHFVRMCSNVLK